MVCSGHRLNPERYVNAGPFYVSGTEIRVNWSALMESLTRIEVVAPPNVAKVGLMGLTKGAPRFLSDLAGTTADLRIDASRSV